MVGISNIWNIKKEIATPVKIEELINFSLDAVELCALTPSSYFREIRKFVKRNKVNVYTLHNYCPIPRGKKSGYDPFLLTIPFEKARQEAVKWAKKTLEHASCLDAKVVILHLGEVGEPGNAFKQIQSNLTREYKGGEITLKEMKLRIKALFKERNSQAGAYLEASKRSLAELLNFAVKKKIKLALETRYFFHQIPNFEEIGVLLEEFKSENLGYWHDCGHAQLSENLGLTRHEEFLEAYQERLIGIHLHDIKFDTDHLAPFKGELNFSLLRKYVQGNVAKILEVNQAQTQAEVMLAIKKLRALKII